MITLPFVARRVEHLPCTIEIEHTETSLHAHVELDGDIALERAGRLEQAWTRLAARFELSELYEVSFTPGRLL
jgi:hypothetical protein